MRAAQAAVKRLAPAATAIVAALALWSGTRAAAVRLVGPPGFDVAVAARDGRLIFHDRVRELMTPEAAPAPPPGGTLTAHATFIARRDGIYLWQVGGTATVRLVVDGTWMHAPRPGRVAGKEQILAAGLHSIEVTLMNADA
ncbi:MAG: hypothetical protein JWM53_4696, partial [bacterium]|nr:hypothetical protein [bacterium]